MEDIAYYNLGERMTDAELGVDADGNQIDFKHKNTAHYNIVPKLNKLGKIPDKTSWDSFAYALMMGHNVYCHIVAVQRAQQLMDIEITRFKPNWRIWGIEGKKEKESSDWVPRKILYFATFIEELFNTKTKAEAFELIDNAVLFLRSLEGARLQGGPKQNEFRKLFTFGEVISSKEVDLENPDDDKLRELEEKIKEVK